MKEGASVEKSENDEKYFVVGKRGLKVVEIYGNKPIDGVLSAFIKYILSREVKNGIARTAITKELERSKGGKDERTRC